VNEENKVLINPFAIKTTWADLPRVLELPAFYKYKGVDLLPAKNVIPYAKDNGFRRYLESICEAAPLSKRKYKIYEEQVGSTSLLFARDLKNGTTFVKAADALLFITDNKRKKLRDLKGTFKLGRCTGLQGHVNAMFGKKEFLQWICEEAGVTVNKDKLSLLLLALDCTSKTDNITQEELLMSQETSIQSVIEEAVKQAQFLATKQSAVHAKELRDLLLQISKDVAKALALLNNS
jgi:hypothetical protein